MEGILQAVEKVKFRSSLFKGWWGRRGQSPRIEIVLFQNLLISIIFETKLRKQQIGIHPPNGVEPRAGQSGNIWNLFRHAQMPSLMEGILFIS